MSAFCLCPKNLPDLDAKLKSSGLILLLEEISREPNINSSYHFYEGLRKKNFGRKNCESTVGRE